MKSNLKNTLVFCALVASLGLMPVARMPAQTFTTLHRFAATDPVTGVNFGGANPVAGLILADNTLFGTTQASTPSRNVTMFVVSTDGTVFWSLHDFAIGAQNEVGIFTNSDGANPVNFPVHDEPRIIGKLDSSFDSAHVIDGQNTVTNVISGPQQFFQLDNKNAPMSRRNPFSKP